MNITNNLQILWRQERR